MAEQYSTENALDRDHGGNQDMSENGNNRENEGSGKDGFEGTVLEERFESLSLVDNRHEHEHEHIHERQKDIATNEQMGAIGRVPPEIWQTTLEYMPKSDQVSFSCANKHMRALLAPIIFRTLEFNPSKVELNDFYYYPLKHTTLGPDEFNFPTLHSIIREIKVTQHIKSDILDTLNRRLYAFTSLVVLKIESRIAVSKELYGHIREHPSLRDLDMDMDSDRDVRSHLKRQKYKTIASCRLRSLRAPRWVLRDLLAPRSSSRETLVQLTICHPGQVVALVGKNDSNPLLPNPPNTGMNFSIKSKGLLPLTTVEELRLDAMMEKDSSEVILALLRGLPSLREVDINSDTYLEPPELSDTQQTRKISGLLLRHLRSLSGPVSVLSLLMPFLRTNVLKIHANDNDLSVWELIPDFYLDKFLRSTSRYASFTQEIKLDLQVMTVNKLKEALEAIPASTGGFPSLKRWILRWDTGSEVEDRTLPMMLEVVLTPMVGKIPTDCEVHLSLPGITDNLHLMVQDVNDGDHVQPVVDALDRNRLRVWACLLDWVGDPMHVKDIFLKSIFVRDWDVTWFSFRCLKPIDWRVGIGTGTGTIETEEEREGEGKEVDGKKGGEWEVEVDPDRDYAFSRLRIERPEEMVKHIRI
ncbi:hypothetical protein FRC16_000446 [Serendipita sp. 398]|nr:hypothetical protein FRC16_000446 [Serendipita sp. 398]